MLCGRSRSKELHYGRKRSDDRSFVSLRGQERMDRQMLQVDERGKGEPCNSRVIGKGHCLGEAMACTI